MKPISADDGERIGRLSSCVIQAFSWLLLLSEPSFAAFYTAVHVLDVSSLSEFLDSRGQADLSVRWMDGCHIV